MQRPPDTRQRTSPPLGQQSSSIPRPSLNSNAESHRANSRAPAVSLLSPAGPSTLPYPKARAQRSHGGASSATPRSQDTSTLRSASGPALKGVSSSPSITRSRGGEKASFRDLVAKFNHASPASGSQQRSSRRSASSNDDVPEDRTIRNRGASNATDRPSPLLSSLQNTVDRVNGASSTSVYGKSSSEPRGSQQQVSQPRTTDYAGSASSGRRVNPPLFGEIAQDMSPWQSGYALPSGSHQRNRSDGSMRHPNPMFSHSRATSDVSIPKTPTFDASFSGSNVDTTYPASPHSRSRSDQAARPYGSFRGNGIGPHSSTHQNESHFQSPEGPTSQSRIPMPSSHSHPIPSISSENDGDRLDPRPATPTDEYSNSGYQGRSPGRTSSGQRLRAVINVPTLQTSPPLRSSRPRKDVQQARSSSPDAGRSPLSEGEHASANTQDDGSSDTSHAHPEGKHPMWTNPAEVQYHHLPNTTYQRPGQNLTIDVQDVSTPSGDDPTSAATTQFEDDTSPSAVDMPGSFPESDETQGSKDVSNEPTLDDQETPNPNDYAFGAADGLSHRSRTVLSQIMEMRRIRDTGQSPSNISQSAVRSSLGTDTDAGTIEIMLGDTPDTEHSRSQWYDYAEKGANQALDPGRGTSSLSASPRTRGNLDSDAGSSRTRDDDYSAIDRILEQYHQSGVVSPQMVHDFEQYLMDVEPELLEGNDPENIAKAALEGIIRDHEEDNETSPGVQDSQPQEDPSDQWNARNDEAGDHFAREQRTYEAQRHLPNENTATARPRDQPLMSRDGSYSTLAPSINPTQAMPSSDQPFLPHTPSTGGSLGFNPDSGHRSGPSNAGFPVDAPASDDANGISGDQDPTAKSALQPEIESFDPSSSTPASTIPDTHSITESQRTKSSMTSSTEAPSLDHNSTDRSPSSSTDVEQKRITKRRQIIKEIVDTEASFQQDMKIVEDIYKATSGGCEDLTPDDCRILFGNSAQIVSFSQEFLKALKKAAAAVYVMPRKNQWKQATRDSKSIADSDNGGEDATSTLEPDATDKERDTKTTIGETFNEYMTRIEEVYAAYLKNHDLANQRLKRVEEIPKVKIWLSECSAYARDLTSGWNLDSMLVKPVQRLLKYPLLLGSLLETTPETHTDYAALQKAQRDMVAASIRINESKKRAEVLEQVMNAHKKKDFDISKLLGRRTDKLRQQVGLSDAVDDPEYRREAQRFETRFVHMQLVMRDFEFNKQELIASMSRLDQFMNAIEDCVGVSHTTSPELESKWRKLVMTYREMHSIAHADHDAAITKHCVEPLASAVKLYAGPQQMMMKRKKRIVEYAKYLTAKNKGEKLDKRTTDQAEQYMALNETLKAELPKLFDLSSKLMYACLDNFVELQMKWYSIWQRKAATVLEDQLVPEDYKDIIDSFNGDFEYVEAHTMSLGICNGSLFHDISNYLSSSGASFSTNETSSTTRPSLQKSGYQSPVLPAHDFERQSGSSFNIAGMSGRNSSESQIRQTQQQQQQHGQSYYQERFRANSNVSSKSAKTPQAPNDSSKAAAPYIPHHESRQQRAWESRDPRPQQQTQLQPESRVPGPPPAYPQPQPRSQSHSNQRPLSSSTFYTATPDPQGASPNTGQPRQFSNIFSSAMPMDDSPPCGSRPATPEAAAGKQEYDFMFAAASLYDFRLQEERREFGYPYLFYAPGEVFDVIAQHNELYLAQNQDDPSHKLGWIWEKHFAVLPTT